MWIYWALFMWPALAAFAFLKTRQSAAATNWIMLAYAIVLTLVIGLRFEVGVDWGNYLGNLDATHDQTWREILEAAEPGYNGISWIATHTDTGIWFVNLLCAIAFVSGLHAFCRRLPNPWLALAIATPYISIVMAMNYSRQGAAFGFVLWALLALHDGRMRRFVFLIVVASVFHKSAAVLMPLGALVSVTNRWWVVTWIGVASLAAYWGFIAPEQASLRETYLAAEMASDGALVRLVMNAIPAVAFLVTMRRFDMARVERRFWTWMSIATLLFLPAFWISPSTTAVDRIALYFMPIQLIGFSHLSASDSVAGGRMINVFLVILAYAIVQYVWFNYSNYYFAWLPYRFYPLEVL